MWRPGSLPGPTFAEIHDYLNGLQGERGLAPLDRAKVVHRVGRVQWTYQRYFPDGVYEDCRQAGGHWTWRGACGTAFPPTRQGMAR